MCKLLVPDATLNHRRSQYSTAGEYPYWIGECEELERIEEAAEFNEQHPAEIINASLSVDLNQKQMERSD